MYLIFKQDKFLGTLADSCLDTSTEGSYSVEFTDTVYNNLLEASEVYKLNGYTYMNISLPIEYMKFLPKIAEKVQYKLKPKFTYL